MKNFYLVEKLGILNWFFQVLPRLLRDGEKTVHVLDASGMVFSIARFFGRIFGRRVERFSFRLVEVRDGKEMSIRLRIPYSDTGEIQDALLRESGFSAIVALREEDERWKTYVFKSVIGADMLEDRFFLTKSLFLVQVCAWHAVKTGVAAPVLFLNRRPWEKILADYGKRNGVKVAFIFPGFSFNPRNWTWHRLKRAYQYYLLGRWCWRHKRFARLLHPSGNGKKADASPKIAIDYYGCFNLEKPSGYSDFFFWQQSDLAARDILPLFRIYGDPLDAAKRETLRKKGIQGAVLHPRAGGVPDAVPYLPKMRDFKPSRVRSMVASLPLRGLEKKWSRGIVYGYEWWYHYWKDVFSSHAVKVYVTWYKYDGVHCALGAALRDLGGCLGVYQRALDLSPLAETQLHSDLYFGSSPLVADIERRVKSRIPYFIVTGYLGDHRFPLLRKEAGELRHRLRAAGASYVVSFTDENSGDDPRWKADHPFIRVNYAFLLNKLLENPWMGLVLKPKVPRTLRHRLGECREMLDRALATGRCFLYEEGVIQGTQPPAVAALAADIAIHGHLCAPTAGFESALAGTPTLLIDREGWPASPLYQVKDGRIAFRDWESLWEAVLEHRNHPGKETGIGQWGSFLDELDSFRDGKSAYRMGTYLQWLIEGFKKGERREAVLESAAERYRKEWGRDKVIEVA